MKIYTSPTVYQQRLYIIMISALRGFNCFFHVITVFQNIIHGKKLIITYI